MRKAPVALQTWRRLSLPPEASWVPLGDHFRPHTSCSWPRSTPVICSRILQDCMKSATQF